MCKCFLTSYANEKIIQEGKEGRREGQKEGGKKDARPLSFSYNNDLQQKGEKACLKGFISTDSYLCFCLILIFPSINKEPLSTGTHLNHGKWNPLGP